MGIQPVPVLGGTAGREAAAEMVAGEGEEVLEGEAGQEAFGAVEVAVAPGAGRAEGQVRPGRLGQPLSLQTRYFRLQ